MNRTRLPIATIVFFLSMLLLQFAPYTIAVAANPMTRAQALKALTAPSSDKRVAAVNRIGEVGLMSDTDALVKRLHDDDNDIRILAESALWEVWSRSEDAKVGALFERGLEEMDTRQTGNAIATLTEVIRLKPEFAEGWNKRATVYFLTGRFKESIADCGEVIKRNPKHFGALAGFGLNYLKLGQLERALDYFQQALAVNPNMDAVARSIEVTKQRLEEQGKNAI